MSILIVIIMFGALVFFHEFGHFISARIFGVRVEEFALGFGPTLWKKQGKHTTFALHGIPLGGYCAMKEEADGTGDSFGEKRWWQRLIILAAGALMNFILGFVLLICIFSAMTQYITPQISGFMEGCPSAELLQEGDTILKINGHRVYVYSDFSTLLQNYSDGRTADFTVLRDGKKVTIEDVPCYTQEYETESGTQTLYGFTFTLKDAGVGDRLRYAFCEGMDLARSVWMSLQGLLNGAFGVRDLSGPIGIVTVTSEVTAAAATTADAVRTLLYLTAFISINLGIMNLLPIPALDGGRILFLLLNVLLSVAIKKQIPDKYENLVHTLGFLLLLVLMVVVAFSDVFRLMGY